MHSVLSSAVVAPRSGNNAGPDYSIPSGAVRRHISIGMLEGNQPTTHIHVRHRLYRLVSYEGILVYSCAFTTTTLQRYARDSER